MVQGSPADQSETYHHACIGSPNPPSTNNAHRLSLQKISHKPAQQQHLSATPVHFVSRILKTISSASRGRAIEGGAYRVGSHPSYLPARMKSSASTTRRAAESVRAAASSAVVSVSTPCRGFKQSQCDNGLRNRKLSFQLVYAITKAVNHLANHRQASLSRKLTDHISDTKYALQQYGELNTALVLTRVRKEETYRSVSNSYAVSSSGLHIHVVVTYCHVAVRMPSSLLQSAEKGVSPVLCQLQ